MTSMSLRQLSIRLPTLIKKVGALKTFSTQVHNTKGKNGKNNGSGSNSSWTTGGFAAAAAAATGLSLAGAASVTLMEANRKKKRNAITSHYPQPASMVPSPDSGTPTTIPKPSQINSPPPRPDLPIFSRDEVAEHCDEDSLWYSFRGGVYDLTPFYQGHPGGAPVSAHNIYFWKRFFPRRI